MWVSTMLWMTVHVGQYNVKMTWLSPAKHVLCSVPDLGTVEMQMHRGPPPTKETFLNLSRGQQDLWASITTPHRGLHLGKSGAARACSLERKVGINCGVIKYIFEYIHQHRHLRHHLVLTGVMSINDNVC